MRTPRMLVRRTVFLLAGGAVAAALAILASALIAPVQEDVVVPTFVVLLILMLGGVGLLPGVREVQVAGAEALLGVSPERVTAPEPTRWAHRWRTGLWTVIHLVAGAVTGLLILAAGLPIAGMLVLLLDGRPIELPGWSVQVPTTVGGWALALLIATVIVVVSTAIIAGLGIAAAASAPSLLGPVGEDRLRLAERRLEHEQASLRLSRDLHDGVGHSLSAISLQAGAGRRAVACGGDPDALIQTLHTIEELSGRAVQELDHALSVLRGETSTEPASTAGGDADADKHPDPVAARKPVAKTAAVGRVGRMDLGRLENLVSEHRALGMELEVQLPTSEQISDLPPVLSRAAYRVTAEALANASKHGVAGARVVLNLRRLSHELALDVHNQIADRDPDGSPAAGPSDSNGRGLDALREQLAILGGTISAGPDPVPGEDGPGTGPWHLRVNLPTGGGPRG